MLSRTFPLRQKLQKVQVKWLEEMSILTQESLQLGSIVRRSVRIDVKENKLEDSKKFM